MKKRPLLLLIVCLLVPLSSASAEDVNEIFKKVNELIAAENYPKAIEELAWAEKEIQKKHFKKLGTMIPETLAGFEGEPLKTQSVMGIETIERTYKKGREKIRLSITGGSSANAAGGFAALGRMAAAMGTTQPGSDTFRIDGRTATLVSQNNRSEVSVVLESGSLLKLELRNSKEPAESQSTLLRAAIDEMKIAPLDSYLKGAS